MPTVDRIAERGTRRGRRALAELGSEFRTKRVAVGLSQRQVAAAAGMGRSTYTHIESGSFGSLSILAGCRIAAVLGLDLSLRAYPGPNPLRDVAQVKRLARVQAVVGAPLACKTEVVLPLSPDRPFEQRAWDAAISGADRRTTMDLEMRIADAQALERRIGLKRRDDPSNSFVLLVADTHANRRVLRENPGLFPDVARMTFMQLARLLEAGHHPPNALVLL